MAITRMAVDYSPNLGLSTIRGVNWFGKWASASEQLRHLGSPALALRAVTYCIENDAA
jgi:hypothetical protein